MSLRRSPDNFLSTDGPPPSELKDHERIYGEDWQKMPQYLWHHTQKEDLCFPLQHKMTILPIHYRSMSKWRARLSCGGDKPCLKVCYISFQILASTLVPQLTILLIVDVISSLINRLIIWKTCFISITRLQKKILFKIDYVSAKTTGIFML